MGRLTRRIPADPPVRVVELERRVRRPRVVVRGMEETRGCRPGAGADGPERRGAVIAACSGVLHGFSLLHATSAAATVLTVAMLAACMFCARDLWARGTLRAWALVA